MKLKVCLLEVKIQQYLYMKKLACQKLFFSVVANTILQVNQIHTLHHGHVTHFLKIDNP